jgi:polysaccharide transporter, PST family
LFSALKTFFSRPGVQAATGNLGWLVAEKGIRLVFTVGVGFWVARYLGPAAFGELNFALAIVGIALLLAELGLDGVVRRELIRAPAEAEQLLATVWGLRLLGAGAAGLLVGLWGCFSENENLHILLPVLALTLFQPVLWVSDLWFQARLQAKRSVLAQLGGAALGAGVRVGMIVLHAPLVAFAWAAVIEMVAAGLLLAWVARRDGLVLRPKLFDQVSGVRLLREAWPLLLSGFAVVLYLRMDAVMLRYMAGETAVGIYAAAVRFTEIWYFVPMVLATSLLPSLLRAKERGARDYAERLQLSYDLNAGIAFLIALPLSILAPWVIGVAYGAGYASAAPVLTLHVWSVVFVFLGVARGQFLVNEGYTRFYLAATGAGLFVNVVLNWILIPRHGAWGAALATVIGQAVAAWLSSFCFAPVRSSAWMQARALLIPFRWFRYVHRP